MATATENQHIAANRVLHLPADKITCRYCGEVSATGTWKAYAHFWGPRGGHLFTAAKPK